MQEAKKLAGLDWTVSQYHPTIKTPAGNIEVDRFKVNVRDDDNTILGIVGKSWVPIQNHETADFCNAIVDDESSLRVETAGSIRGGKKMWFLLRGETFDVKGTKGDTLGKYLLVSNGFDGKTGFRITPTTIRVVCSNTLHAVIPRKDNKGRTVADSAAIVIQHTGVINDKIEAARSAIATYGKIGTTREAVDYLALKDITDADCKRFFLDAYSKFYKPIPKNPKTAIEENQKQAASEALSLIHI